MAEKTQRRARRRAGGSTRAKLVVRWAKRSDADAIAALSRRIYAPAPWTTRDMARAQINNFPDGQFVAEYDGKIVGHCATFVIGGDVAMRAHTWAQITGQGFAARHDPKGDYLYGMDVNVDPDHRRLRIGQRLYDARKRLCEDMKLKGIILAGRMPGYARHARANPDPEAYLEEVVLGRRRDSTVTFQLANGFEPLGVLRDYDPDDKASRGHAAHMIWRNPLYIEGETDRAAGTGFMPKETIRVAAVQLQMRAISTLEEFEQQIEYFVDVASDYRSDFVVFPELFTLQILSMEKATLSSSEAIDKIATLTDWFVEWMSRLAISYNINIIGGTHPTRVESGDLRNTAYVFLRDGSVHTREKIHPTPSEAYWWNFTGGSRVAPIDSDCGPIGVVVCYDSEFPELSRHLVDQGATILFVPFCTDDRRSYLRVRYCAHARAIENQCYVVLAGVVGNLPNVENMDIHYAESCILTPCDVAFARDGVAADTGANTETIAFADLHLSDLRVARSSGTVRNLKDRRFDLYRVVWNSAS